MPSAEPVLSEKKKKSTLNTGLENLEEINDFLAKYKLPS